MLSFVARFVDRTACNGEAAPMIARLRSSGLALGSAADGVCRCCKAASIEYCCQVRYCWRLSLRVNACFLHVGVRNAAASIISGFSYLRWYRRCLGLAHVSSDTEP
jgi:hypothetical protein